MTRQETICKYQEMYVKQLVRSVKKLNKLSINDIKEIFEMKMPTFTIQFVNELKEKYDIEDDLPTIYTFLKQNEDLINYVMNSLIKGKKGLLTWIDGCTIMKTHQIFWTMTILLKMTSRLFLMM